MKKIEFAVAQLNVPYGGNLLPSGQFAQALMAGSALIEGISDSSAALIYTAFSEITPQLIVECVFEIGSSLYDANLLYEESVREQGLRAPSWEEAIGDLL